MYPQAHLRDTSKSLRNLSKKVPPKSPLPGNDSCMRGELNGPQSHLTMGRSTHHETPGSLLGRSVHQARIASAKAMGLKRFRSGHHPRMPSHPCETETSKPSIADGALIGELVDGADPDAPVVP